MRSKKVAVRDKYKQKFEYLRKNSTLFAQLYVAFQSRKVDPSSIYELEKLGKTNQHNKILVPKLTTQTSSPSPFIVFPNSMSWRFYENVYFFKFNYWSIGFYYVCKLAEKLILYILLFHSVWKQKKNT